MKKLAAIAIASLALSGCAETMYLGTTPCRPYGFLNKEDNKCPQAEYEVRPGNVAVAAASFWFFPFGTALSGYLVGWRLFGPIKPKTQTIPQQ